MIPIKQIEKYINENAREIDRTLYSFHFDGGGISDVLASLAKYQNNDGGFGNAIEPDLRLPQSTAIGTWMALHHVKDVDPDMTSAMAQRGLDYFIDTFDPERGGWAIVSPEADKYPHAPWWEYETAINGFYWGNPSASIFGFLLKYNGDHNIEGMLDILKVRALTRVLEVKPTSFHEVFNFQELYQYADDDLKKKLKGPLERLIVKTAIVDPKKWTSYVATPIKFLSSPDDPFIGLFDQDIISKNLDFIANDIVDGDHWEPNWDWLDHYPEDWNIAKKEWRGSLTVQNMITLKRFGNI